MAEISIETLEQLFEQIKDPSLGVFIDQMKAAGQTLSNFSELAGKVSETAIEKLRNMATATKDMVSAFGGYKEQAEAVQNAGTSLWRQMTEGISNYAREQDVMAGGAAVMGTRLALALEPALGLLPKGVTGMGQLSDAGTSAGSKITDAFANIEPVLSKALGGKDTVAFRMFDTITKGAANVYALEREFGNLAATQGRFSTVLETNTRFGNNLNEMYMNQVNLSYESAVATGQTVASMMDLSRALAPIPEALSEPVTIGVQGMSQLTAVSQLATGFMRDNAEVAKLLGTMYTQMGVSGKEAFVNISNLYEGAGDSKLRFEAFTNTVMSVAGGFKMLGDNTAAATNVVKAFDDVFKDSDISPAAMADVISRMGQGIEKMDMAKMAFVSGATGGPGGLAGGLQMELAIREGRMDEVLGKTMQAMQAQFGGQVLTLEDAAGNEQLAAEFVKQREYLKQVAGIAGTDAEANRILEAMKSGVMDGLTVGREKIETEGDKSLANAVDRGAEEQLRTNSLLMRTNQILEAGMLVRSYDYAQLSTQMGSVEAERMRDARGASRTAASINPEANEQRVPLDQVGFIEDKIAGVKENEFISSSISAIEGVFNRTVGTSLEGKLQGIQDQFSAFKEGKSVVGETRPANDYLIKPDRATSDFLGIGNVPLSERREPASFEELANIPFGRTAEAEGALAQGFEISYQPLEVKVSFDEPFDQKVRLIADQQISRAQQGQVRATANGRSR